MAAWRRFAYRYPWRGMSRWGPRRWRPTADSATLAHALHKKRLRRRAAQIFRSMGFTVNAVTPVQIITGNQTGVNAIGDRAWPEVMGEPPVFGNRIGEIAHTGGGSWIWTGFTWERAILGG